MLDWLYKTQVWKSIFRHGFPSDPRNRSLAVVANVFLHLHPVRVRKHGLRMSFTWCMGGITFLLFLILTVIVIATAIVKSFPTLATPATGIAVFGWVYVPTYLLIAMRRVYRQGWFLTSMKCVLLLTGYAATLIVAVASTAMYTALTL